MNIRIYEDEGYKNFLPLTWTRPVYALRCGISTLAEKIALQYPKAKIEFSSRYYLPGKKTMKHEKGLFINGRVLASEKMAKEIPLKGPDEIFVADDGVVAVRAVTKSFEEVKKRAKTKKVKIRVVKYPWDLIKYNGEQINADWKHLRGKWRSGKKVERSVVFYNRMHIHIEEDVEIGANSVIDARGGPVYIGKGTIVRPLTYLKGPLSIGPVCRVGGEIGESIFHGYVNKQHYGFIGHSYVGEWVNLGAGTTNSDLKNNYSNVRVMVEGQEIDTGEQFVGCVIGDHAKTGIGTLINTGAVIGLGANVIGGKVTGKHIPDFSWNGKERYRIEDFLKTAAVVMGRRGVKMGENEARLLEFIFRQTKA